MFFILIIYKAKIRKKYESVQFFSRGFVFLSISAWLGTLLKGVKTYFGLLVIRVCNGLVVLVGQLFWCFAVDVGSLVHRFFTFSSPIFLPSAMGEIWEKYGRSSEEVAKVLIMFG